MSILANGNVGIGDNTPEATLDVQGTVVIGSAGKIFSEIREVTGLLQLQDPIRQYLSLQDIQIENSRVLSVEINYNGANWNTLGMYYAGLTSTSVVP